MDGGEVDEDEDKDEEEGRCIDLHYPTTETVMSVRDCVAALSVDVLFFPVWPR